MQGCPKGRNWQQQTQLPRSDLATVHLWRAVVQAQHQSKAAFPHLEECGAVDDDCLHDFGSRCRHSAALVQRLEQRHDHLRPTKRQTSRLLFTVCNPFCCKSSCSEC